MQHKKQESSSRTRLNFSSGNISKSLSGDALWKDVVASAGKYTSTSAFGCFAAGTLVHTEHGLVPIQDIKVDDRVLAKPESGEGEVSYKSVLKTFEHKDKELWLVVAKKHWSDEDIHGRLIDSTTYRRADEKAEFIATPNHPVWVVGMGVWDGRQSLEEIIVYPQPHWKRVDQLQQYEVVVNKDNVMYYIDRVQPLYNFKQSGKKYIDNLVAWYPEYYHLDKDTEDYKEYNLNYGHAIDYVLYQNKNSFRYMLDDLYDYNICKNEHGEYENYCNTVYNIEVAEDHTYFVTEAGIWVHNTNCDKAREMLLGALEGDFDKIKTSKNSFSDDITKALNEGKSIEDIKQLAQPAVRQHQLLDSQADIAAVLEQLELQASDIRAQLNSALNLQQQAEQALSIQQQLLYSAQHSLKDPYSRSAFAQMLPNQPLQYFVQQASPLGLTGDALWQEVIFKMSQYTSTSTFGCFAAGTKVQTERGRIPIQDVQVGDLVLSRPENGEGEASYKPVLQTFRYDNKELWLVKLKKHWSDEDIYGRIIDGTTYRSASEYSEFIVTPNHPIWVAGIAVLDSDQHVESISNYPQAHWKRVDQLQQREVVVNKEGILFVIERAQPLYAFETDQKLYSKTFDNQGRCIDVRTVENKPSCMWYQDNYYETRRFNNAEEFYDDEESKDYDSYQDYLAHEASLLKKGTIVDIEQYYEIQVSSLYSQYSLPNLATDPNGHYIPFTDTVYNLEVADHHTYFVGRPGIFVHNTSSPEQTLWQMANDLANQVRTISQNELSQSYAAARQYWLNAGAQATDLKRFCFVPPNLSLSTQKTQSTFR